ncbi:O-methyltransferase [Algoriphagus vanfongensis]|uniref:O-methyltransferase n=1 Tax=Algoriphagus vanfongensis TaxID=426371 RepID=UPI000411DB47|nr:class I SAM-dependent methyltransferase [Algoriphagus vanfongensis]
MGSKIHPLLAYLHYWLLKQDRHAIQSPKVYELYTGLLDFRKHSHDMHLEIEVIRKSLLADSSLIEVLDLGAGSKKVPDQRRKVSDITRYSTSGRKFNLLYQYFASISPAKTIVELGTCMGINARFLSKISGSTVFTFEGSPEILQRAFKNGLPPSISPQLGDISETLPPFLASHQKIDFALIDATHTYEGTMLYFNLLLQSITPQSIICIGDIHWSHEMEKAWKEIQVHPRVQLSLDFYECGVLFFDFGAEKSHYVLNY